MTDGLLDNQVSILHHQSNRSLQDRKCSCLKKKMNASRPSELSPPGGKNVKTFRWDRRLQRQNPFMAFIVVSYIERIGCPPEKLTLHGGQSRSWSAEQGKENKRESLAAYPPHAAHRVSHPYNKSVEY